MAFADPRKAFAFRFVGCDFDAAAATASLRYAFDDGDELVERVVFTGAPALPPERVQAFAAALRLLHLVAGVSYYKAGVPARIVVEGAPLDAASARFVEQVYRHGLAEFAYQNAFHDLGIDLRERIGFPHSEGAAASHVPMLGLPRRTLLPIGGGKDSLVSVERCTAIDEPATAVWIGDSGLIAACAERTGLAQLNIRRTLAPALFELNRAGAWNGHVPVTAINSAVLVCAAILYGYDAIAFSNERSASSATLEYEGLEINHQWSKGLAFEQQLRAHIRTHVAADLDYFSLLRPWSELAIARAFARSSAYDDVFSSCNRNFRILGAHPTERWCGQCPKCHFVFLALAPFVAKPRLLRIFGRNLLDDAALAPGFDALLEYRDHKPFECVGEGRESRAAMLALSERAEWREDALVARFAAEILPQLDARDMAIEPLLAPAPEHCLPARFAAQLAAG